MSSMIIAAKLRATAITKVKVNSVVHIGIGFSLAPPQAGKSGATNKQLAGFSL